MSMTISSVAAMAAGVGAGLSAIGAYNNAKGQKDTLNYEASVASNNQKVAEYQADMAIVNGQSQEQTQRLKNANLMGDQRAALAANGVDLGAGSATEILATTKTMGERDALTIRDNAARTAWAYRNQAQNYGAESAADSASASSISPLGSALTSMLGSAGQVATQWYGYNKSSKGIG